MKHDKRRWNPPRRGPRQKRATHKLQYWREWRRGGSWYTRNFPSLRSAEQSLAKRQLSGAFRIVEIATGRVVRGGATITTVITA